MMMGKFWTVFAVAALLAAVVTSKQVSGVGKSYFIFLNIKEESSRISNLVAMKLIHNATH